MLCSGAVQLTRDDELWILDLGDDDNRFDGDTVPALHAALDELEASTGPGALVTTASGRIWHNGLDLDHVGVLGDDMIGFLGEVHRVFGRLMSLPMPTVAAVVGHAFAGGAMLSLAHDVRIMRADRGYWCLPEVDLGMTFTRPMAALIGSKLAQPALQRLAVLGERVDGPGARELGAVDAAVEGAEGTLAEAVARARALAPKASPTLAALRRDFHASAIDVNLGVAPTP